jgi:AraC-like DNA-binding protein
MSDNIVFANAVLGLFLAMPLLYLTRFRRSTGWLGLFVLALASLSMADHLNRQPEWLGVFDWPVVLLGPLFYAYVCGLTGQPWGWRQAWQLLIPAGLAMLVFFWMNRAMAAAASAGDRAAYLRVYDWLDVVVWVAQGLGLIYLVAVWRRLSQFRKQLPQFFSRTQDRDLHWLNQFFFILLGGGAVWLLHCVFHAVPSWMLFVSNAFVLAFIGWNGMRQFEVFMPDVTVMTGDTKTDGLPPQLPQVRPEEAREKYSKSGMNSAAQCLIAQRLDRCMNEARMFAEPDLTLLQLAQQIGTSPQLLSQYLNQEKGQNFFEYVNGLRVQEVQRLIRVDAGQGSNLLELAFAAGFSSKSTFNASFKRCTGVSPSQWREAQSSRSEPIRLDATETG